MEPSSRRLPINTVRLSEWVLKQRDWKLWTQFMGQSYVHSRQPIWSQFMFAMLLRHSWANFPECCWVWRPLPFPIVILNKCLTGPGPVVSFISLGWLTVTPLFTLSVSVYHWRLCTSSLVQLDLPCHQRQQFTTNTCRGDRTKLYVFYDLLWISLRLIALLCFLVFLFM